MGKQEGPVSGWFRGVLFCGFQMDFFKRPGTNPEDEAAPTVGVLTPRARLRSKTHSANPEGEAAPEPVALTPRAGLRSNR